MRIISGGQTGVDRATLRAARACGFETGGWAPLGWVTEDGPADWLAEYGLVECPEPGYPARRRRNVQDAETMLLMGDKSSRGSIGLLNDWNVIQKQAVWVWVQPGVEIPRSIARFLRNARRDGRPARTVLVAGNRESVAPGLGERAERFMLAVFRKLAEG